MSAFETPFKSRGAKSLYFEFELSCTSGFIVDRCQRSFFNTIFLSSHMYPENPERTQVIVGSMNMGYISDTARNRTHKLVLSQAGADTTRQQ